MEPDVTAALERLRNYGRYDTRTRLHVFADDLALVAQALAEREGRIEMLEKENAIIATKLDALLVLEDAVLVWARADQAAVTEWGDEDEDALIAASDAQDDLIEAAHAYAKAQAMLPKKEAPRGG